MQDQDINTSGKVKVFLEDVLKIIDDEIADAVNDALSLVDKEQWEDALNAQGAILSLDLLKIKVAMMKGDDNATR